MLDYCGNEYHQTAFVSGRTDTLPGGVADFVWNKNQGTLNGAQLYANGLSHIAIDVLDFDKDKGTRDIKTFKIFAYIHSHLSSCKITTICSATPGLVVGDITLKGGRAPVACRYSQAGTCFSPENSIVRLPSYTWSFQMDTHALGDDAALIEQFKSLIKEISWGLGISNVPGVIIEEFLKINGWLPAPATP